MWLSCSYLAILLLLHQVSPSQQQTPPKVLLVAFDGLRFDFINPVLTPTIWNLAQKGVSAPKGIMNQIFTNTAPNFFSMSTGLYEENHGIIGNSFFDPTYPDGKNVYDYWGGSGDAIAKDSLDGRWYTGEPIWQTNEKAGSGRWSGAMAWPMCDARINNLTMTYCESPVGGEGLVYRDWEQQVVRLIAWFKRTDKPVNFGMLYSHFPDELEHYNDIYGPKVRDIIGQLDNLTNYLINQLKDAGLLDSINIIMTADHGHINVERDFTIVTVEELLGNFTIDDIIISQNSIFPRTDRGITTDMIYQQLMDYRNRNGPKFDVYLKDEMPDEWHYKNHPRIGPIFVTEKLGYLIIYTSYLDRYQNISVFGNHGYNRNYPEMRPFFVASGPGFKSGYKISDAEQIENVDIYPLIAYLLNITTIPKIDGRLERMLGLLSSPPTTSTPPASQLGNISRPTLVLVSLASVFAMLVHFLGKTAA